MESGATTLTAIGMLVSCALLLGIALRLVRRNVLAQRLPVTRATVLEMLDDAVLVVNEDSRILDANRSALAILKELQPGFELAPPPSLADCWPSLATLLEEEDPESQGIVIRR